MAISSRLRSRLLVLALGLTVVLGWLHYQGYLVRVPLRPPSDGTGVSISDAIEDYQAHFLLPPDRRFLLAVADARRLATGESVSPVRTEWTGAAWAIRLGDERVADVPELASFDDLFAALVDVSRRSMQLRGGSKGKLVSAPRWSDEEFSPDSAIPALDRLGVAWASGGRTPEIALRAASLLTDLVLQSERPVELPLTDPLAGRALAALATARALDSESGASEECLLAYLLGYSSHAKHLAEGLPLGSPVAAFVLERDAELQRIAEAKSASARARYLHLRTLALRGERGEWRERAQAWTGPPGDLGVVLGTVSNGNDFDDRREFPPFLVAVWTARWLDQAPPKERWLRWALESSQAVDDAIARRAAELDGPFADRDVALGAFGAPYYSAMRALVEFQLHSLASVPGAQRIMDALPRSEKGGVADLRRYLSTRVDWSAGIDVASRRVAIRSDRSPVMGARDRADMLGSRDYVVDGAYSDNDARSGVASLLRTMDSRPDHRELLVPLVRNRLRDQMRANRLEETTARDDGHRRTDLRINVQLREARLDELLSEIGSEGTPAWRLASPLRQIIAKGCPSPERLREVLASLWERDGTRLWIFNSYVSVLEDCAGDYAESERITRQFLADPSSDKSLGRSLATAKLAHAMRLQGKREEAWKTLEPELGGQVGNVLAQAIHALIDLQRYSEAETLARAALERYPDHASFSSAIAKANWRAGRPEAAARAVTSPEAEISSQEFADTVVDYFWHAFESSPIESVLRAFDELLRRDAQNGLEGRVTEIPVRFSAEGRHDVAFEMYARLARVNTKVHKNPDVSPLYEPAEALFSRDPQRATMLAAAWRSLRALKGDAEAARWIQALRPSGYPWHLSPHFFNEQAYELLWVAYPQEKPGEYVWLLRATAAALNPELMKQHGDSLRAYFARRTDVKDHFLGRVTLGLESEEELRALPLGPIERCQLAYHLGVAVEGRGDLAGALDLYEVSVASGAHSFNAYSYSRDRLDAWRKTNASFSAPERKAPATPGRVAGL